MSETKTRSRAGLMAYEVGLDLFIQTIENDPWEGEHPLIGWHEAALQQARWDLAAAKQAVREAYGT